jgi:hypothetical protein
MHTIDLTDEDVNYVRSTFQPQSDADRERAAAGIAPQPSYVLPDGTAMVSAAPDPDLAQSQDPADLRGRFATRWTAAGGRPEEVDAQLAEWLDGIYALCLRSPGPEAILAKGGLADAITALIARPLPEEAWWRETLRHAVAAYDALVLPFASTDPARFGVATSRMRLIDAVREQWPEVFTPDPA